MDFICIIILNSYLWRWSVVGKEDDHRYYPENISTFIYTVVIRAWRAYGYKPVKKGGRELTLEEAVHSKIQDYLRYGRNAHRDLIEEGLKVTV